jgi:hypothetical protein
LEELLFGVVVLVYEAEGHVRDGALLKDQEGDLGVEFGLGLGWEREGGGGEAVAGEVEEAQEGG